MQTEIDDKNASIGCLETTHYVKMKRKYDEIKILCRQKQGDRKAVNEVSL